MIGDRECRLIAACGVFALGLGCDDEPAATPREAPPELVRAEPEEPRPEVEPSHELEHPADDLEAEVSDDALDMPPPMFTYILEQASLSELARIFARITGAPVATASVLHGLLDCVAISVTGFAQISAAHVIEVTRVALASIQLELRQIPAGFVIRPMDGRTIECGATGSSIIDQVPAPATEYVPRDAFADPLPGELDLTIEGASLPELANELSNASGQTFDVDPSLVENDCVRVTVQGGAPLALDGLLELVRLAVADANVELDRRYVFRPIGGRAPRCSARP
jgi:hypothetical protein